MSFLRLFLSRKAAFVLPVLLGGAMMLAPLAVQAADFVSIKSDTVNVRARPTTKSEILWKLSKGYPLQVEERQTQWIKVRDFEDTLGWVSAPLTDQVPHRVIRAGNVNLRAGPGTDQKIVAKMDRLEVVRTVGSSGSWVEVERSTGERGWVAESLAWGW